MSAESQESRYSFGEAVADLAIMFAHAEFTPEDSRQITRLCIEWAEIFEAKNRGREWDGEYMEEIEHHFTACYADFIARPDEPIRPNPFRA